MSLGVPGSTERRWSAGQRRYTSLFGSTVSESRDSDAMRPQTDVPQSEEGATPSTSAKILR